jgi:hypothetical protein
VVDVLAVGVVVGSLVLVSVLALRRNLDAFEIGGAIVGLFLLANKVYSPNYDLWIVPFFVLLPVARRTWIAFVVSDLAVFVLVYGHFHVGWSSDVVKMILPALLLVRTLAIIDVILVALHVRRPVFRMRQPVPPVVA